MAVAGGMVGGVLGVILKYLGVISSFNYLLRYHHKLRVIRLFESHLLTFPTDNKQIVMRIG